jgi:hypothetical protein
MNEIIKQPGASTGKETKIPAIPVVRTGNRELDQHLQAVKEYIEVREGSRGNPFDRGATMRDLATALNNSQIVGNATTVAVPTATQAATNISSPSETAKIRADIARTERTLRGSIEELNQRFGDLSLSAAQTQALAGSARYTRAKLEEDLATGAATIISGATSGTAVMELAPDGAYVLFKHKDANINGLGAGYTGVVRTAVGITGAGLLAGFNRKSDGAFQPSIVIDSATGDVTILGTLKANSVIEVGAFVGTFGGTTMGTVRDNASYAAVNVDTKLSKNASDILSGSISFTSSGGFKTGTIVIDASGNATGAGVAFTSKGIVGRTSTKTTFTINATTGNAIFSGDITTDGDAVFNGSNQTAFPIFLVDDFYVADYSVHGRGASNAFDDDTLRVGVLGSSAATISQYNIGVLGYAQSTSKGFGVVGVGGRTGGWFTALSSGGPALFTSAFSTTDVALDISRGKVNWAGYTYSEPPGGATTLLRANGTWGQLFIDEIQVSTARSASYESSTDGGATWTSILLRRV